MRHALLLPLLVLACVSESPGLTANGERCETLALTVLDSAVLPGWKVHAMVAERVDGDAVWTVASDPEGALMLKPWPQGPAHDLSGLGQAEDLSLLRGRAEGESWLLLGDPDRLRVWRLGAAATGEVASSPDLSGFAGPGRWTYQLLLVGDAPYVLAMSTGMPALELQLRLAPLDPDSLELGEVGPAQKFAALCEPAATQPCSLVGGNTALTEVRALAVSEAGTMAGVTAMFGLSFSPEDSVSPAFMTLQAIDRGVDQAPELVGRVVGLFAAKNSSPQRGRLAVDGDALYVSALVADGKVEEAGFAKALTHLEDRSNGDGWLRWDQGGALLQLGAAVIVGDLVEDRWQFSRVEDGEVMEPVPAAELALPKQTQMWSAGHEQLFMRPPVGPALRVGALCGE